MSWWLSAVANPKMVPTRNGNDSFTCIIHYTCLSLPHVPVYVCVCFCDKSIPELCSNWSSCQLLLFSSLVKFQWLLSVSFRLYIVHSFNEFVILFRLLVVLCNENRSVCDSVLKFDLRFICHALPLFSVLFVDEICTNCLTLIITQCPTVSPLSFFTEPVIPRIIFQPH